MARPRHSHRREWPDQVADSQRYGKASAGQLAEFVGFIRLIPQFEREFIADWNRENKTEKVGKDAAYLNWSGCYEMPLGAHIAALMLCFTSSERLLKIAASPDQAKDLIALTKEADDPAFFAPLEGISQQEALVILALLMSLTRNIKSMRAYGLSINELLSKGDDESIFRAITIDPAVMGCQIVSSKICLAQMGGGKDCKRRLRTALKGSHTGRLPYGELRIAERMLHEIGAYQESRDDLAALLIEKLKLYNATGENPLKGLFSCLHAYRREATN